MKMKAFRLTAWQQPPELLEVPVPEPGPGQVLIKVAGSGACHSDLHLMEWPEGMLNWRVPFTLGHEATGWVAALGPGVTGLEVGAAVAVYGPWGCGTCRNCRLGQENYCEHSAELAAAGGGLGFDGGMADYMLIPSPRLLLPLGELEPIAAAPLSDAALTPYHAIKRSLPLLVPGSTAVVVGVGGLGHMAVQILRALTPARIVAVDKDPAKLRLALDVGADRAIQATDEAAGEVRSATAGGHGADVVLDFVGADATIALGAKVTRPLAHLTIVGLAMGTFPFNFFALPYEVSIASTYWGSAVELQEVLELARSGKIRAHFERFALADAAEAYALLKEGKLDGRAVIVPGQVTAQLDHPAQHELLPIGGGLDDECPRD